MKWVLVVSVVALALFILLKVKSQRMEPAQSVAEAVVVAQPVAETTKKRMTRVRVPFGTYPPRVVGRDGRSGASIKKRVVIGRVPVAKGDVK